MEEIITQIENKEAYNLNETFDLYKLCAQLIIDDQQKVQTILVNILNNRPKFDSSLDSILSDLIEAIGFYPYLSKEHLSLDSTNALIRQNYHYSDNLDKYLHEDQKYLLSLLNSDKNVIVSAPTSFGKSLLIEEFVASKKFKNIIIIQPTLALLDETRKKLKKYDNDYKILVRTSQEPSHEKGNIFLFTAERVNEYKEFPSIDFLVIDEFYKLSAKRDDERAASLNNAFNYILKTFNSKFYLLGPNIDNISPGFTEKYNAIFYKTTSSLVDTKVIDIYTANKEIFDKTTHHKKHGFQESVEIKENILFELLRNQSHEQWIIYCSSPNRVRDLSNRFLNYIIQYQTNNNDLDIIEWIRLNISEDWSLINLLKNKIGVHDGALQKHITSSIINYFNDGELNYLFCTTTIIEGVNTSAKNIVFYDSIKGKNTPIDFFDYSNIKGRAGRLMIHYTGAIYNFNPIPENSQIIIDIPFFEQNPISNEVLIHLDENEVLYKETEQYKSIRDLPQQEKDIIKNNGVHVFGQKNIIESIRNDIRTKYDLIAWSQTPNYRQLEYCLKLGWDNLMVDGESKSVGLARLVNKTFNYGMNRNMAQLIQNDINYTNECIQYYFSNKDRQDVVGHNKSKFNHGQKYSKVSQLQIKEEFIMSNFQIYKHWFQYKIPKWLAVINSIQTFVCNERGLRPGNYNYYTNLIENEFLRENLSILAEFGIPASAIHKLERLIPANISQDDVILKIRNENIFDNPVFIDYERNKLKEN